MPSIVFETPQGKRLVGGIDWRLLPASGSVDGNLREEARHRGATHATLATARLSEGVQVKGKRLQIQRVSAGLFSSVEGAKPLKGSHSLAAAFAQWSRQHETALLNVQTGDGKFAVVVVINGLPIFDKIEEDGKQAFESTLQFMREHPAISVFSDDLEKYPSSQLTQNLLDRISKATSKVTALKPIPADAAKLSILAILVLSAATGWMYYSKYKAAKLRQEAIARQRAADPIPKYLNALATARQSVGVEREALQASAEAVQRFPLAPEGWRITRVGCSLGLGCEVVFFRSTGTYKSLQAAMPFLELSPSSDINLNEARMTWKQALPAERLDPATQLPALSQFLQGADASKLQTWLVAGLAVQLTPPMLWPQAPGVPQSFKHPQALAAGKFEVSSVALPQLAEAISTAPSNVSWTSWRIEVGDAKQEPLSRAKARLTGNYYVTNH
ncbi:Pilin accessory protein (PilO) (plasmid) [Variovorax sp. SRS16]|uniref:type 4b pilus protein PilO2 n=1 Tax=Variovorax sp. SRS16 TaxID=282217 RepID=UPI0013197255|nr:type 4b pilus protein PilO2 [Variovorax sp. SRS16]VTU46185.1 Pilin accessory protein (PilO) [Variovorax sp. SRS16]